ncbi:MAG: SpoIIE family protein phosphatase [Leptospiraceae bacterium]|nr:SpoIIE family protein phosphatase [Leptospiraceae bacterium]
MKNWFLFSHYSVLAFVNLIFFAFLSGYLLLKKNKGIVSYYLGSFFLIHFLMLFGFLILFSSIASWNFYHSIFTNMILFSGVCFNGFVYLHSEKIFSKESKYVSLGMFAFAFCVYLHSVFVELSAEKDYIFSLHAYCFSSGTEVGIALLILWAVNMTILFRKQIVNYKNISLSYTAFTLTCSFYFFTSQGTFESSELYLAIFLGTLVFGFLLFSFSINHLSEQTTFKVRIVGLSLLVLLCSICFIAIQSLKQADDEYNKERIAEIKYFTPDMIEEEFTDVPESIEYIVQKPAFKNPSSTRYNLLYSKKSLVSSKDIRDGEKNEKSTRWQGKPAYERNYRTTARGDHFIHYTFIVQSDWYEVGYEYPKYRTYLTQKVLFYLYCILGISVLLLIIFPLFLDFAVGKPLHFLDQGIEQASLENFDSPVPILINDEIGYVSNSFNAFVDFVKKFKKQKENYIVQLESNISEISHELKDRMEEVQKLKVQQDGDYFLTSLLAKPLSINSNKSDLVSTDFIVKQKKEFVFRNRKGDVGGDICITGNLKLGATKSYKEYTVVMNGDAMGKSIQGAGGALVAGVAMNSILARASQKILNMTPDKWLEEVYIELNTIFHSFSGSMALSAIVLIVEDNTGEAWYFNAEHPFSVLYRAGETTFIESSIQLRKIGFESEIPFKVQRLKLSQGDIVIIGSDGRDDLYLHSNENQKTINEDETLFLQHVKKAKGDLKEIEKNILKSGSLTDDLSLMRLGFQENAEAKPQVKQNPIGNHNEATNFKNLNELLLKGKKLYMGGDITKAISLFMEAYSMDEKNQKLGKLLGLLCFKGKNYEIAVRILNQYLIQDPDTIDLWYYLSIAHKRLGNFLQSIEAAKKIYEIQPDNVYNLINLSDLYRRIGKFSEARFYSNKAIEIDPENKNARKLYKLLNKVNAGSTASG